MDSLVERLDSAVHDMLPEYDKWAGDMYEAIARIEKLETALREIMDFRPKAIGGLDARLIARTALEAKP